jgi:hypothetical protein
MVYSFANLILSIVKTKKHFYFVLLSTCCTFAPLKNKKICQQQQWMIIVRLRLIVL